MLDADFLSGAKMPPRSQLYSLPMSGQSGHDQETLLDYAQRLAVEHCVKVRHLFASVILPVANLPGLIRADGAFGQQYLRNCHGHNKYATRFLAAMEHLTMKGDLARGTLIPWGPLIDPRCRGLLAPSRRWCPLCIGEQQDKGAVRHHLVWAVSAVEICPTHRVPLQARCAACAKTQPNVHDAVALGNCSYCGLSLAQRLLDDRTSIPASPKAIYMANAVCEMISHGPEASRYAKPELLRQRLTECAQKLTDGSVYKLERALNLSKRAIGNPGRRSLGLLLDITYRLGVTPVELLAGTRSASLDAEASKKSYRQKTRPVYSIDADLTRRVEECLQRALLANDRLTTKVEMCKEVGVILSFLTRRFPHVVATLREHNNAIRPEIRQAMIKKRIAIVHAAMQDLVLNGGPYTSKAVAQALKKMGLSRRDPELRGEANERLNRLRFPVTSLDV